MELLLILTYTAICVVIFKLFRIPLNKWTVPTAVLGGVLIIGTLFMMMNYNHPYSESTRLYFTSVPIVPQVRGRIAEIPVEVNTPISEGDVLYRIDDVPFRDKVEALEARLDGAMDDRDHAQLERDRSTRLQAKGAGSDRTTERWRAQYEEAAAKVDDLEAQLHQARFDLDSTVVRAPSDGIVTQLTARPGMMAGRVAFSAVMVFLPRDEAVLIGWYRQNSLLRLTAGDEAEVAFDALPGQVFKAKVKQVLPVIAEGQLTGSADLIEYRENTVAGRMAVELELDDPLIEQYDLPQGLYGQSAIYTDHAHHVALLRRILLRMSSWLNYVFPFH
ncbi:MAG: HlyD family secretion protein [Pseudomonadota bacterium]|nr:HlyD family secretion protein [Pseudomonadota bacterium]